MLSITSINFLNSLAESLEKEGNNAKITFYTGELLERTVDVCTSVCPFSKVAVLHTAKSYGQTGKILYQLFKAKGLTPVNIICEQNEITADMVTLSDSMPENVRLIVTVTQEHIYTAQRLAKSREIECVIGLAYLPHNVFCAFNPRSIRFIIDQNLKVQDFEVYEDIVCKIVCLLDIKIKQFFLSAPKKFELTLCFARILDSSLLLNLKAPSTQKLVEGRIALELVQRALECDSAFLDVKSTLCLVKLMASSFSQEAFAFPNYVERAKAVSERYGIEYLSALQNLKAQLDRQKEFNENLVDIKKGISALARAYADKIPKIVDNYIKLGGKSHTTLKQVMENLKYAGDIHYYINSASLLREAGVLEF